MCSQVALDMLPLHVALFILLSFFFFFLKRARIKLEWFAHTGTLDIADDGTGSVVHELDADLGDTTTGTCIAIMNQRGVLISHPVRIL